jgi:hypothetical protein
MCALYMHMINDLHDVLYVLDVDVVNCEFMWYACMRIIFVGSPPVVEFEQIAIVPRCAI